MVTQPGEQHRRRAWTPTSAALALGTLWGLVAMGTSATSVVLGEIDEELDLSVTALALILTLFSLTYAAATPTFGRIADTYGPRVPYLVGATLLSAGAMAAALAPDVSVLLVARAVQGVGAGSVPVLTNAIISARFSGHDRAVALGRVSSLVVIMASVGPLLGGLLGAIGGWRLAVAVPALAIVGVALTYRLAPTEGSGAPLDVVGLLLLGVASGSALLLVQSVSAGTAVALGALVVTALLAVMVAVRIVRRPDGFPPRELVTNPVLWRGSLSAGTMPVVYYASLVVVPLTLAQRGWSPLANGMLLLPGAVIGATVSFNSARVIARLGRSRTAEVGLLIAAFGAVWVSALSVHPGFAAVGFVGLASGYALAQPTIIGAISASVPASERGSALGLFNLVFFSGAGLGAALVGALGDTLALPSVMLVAAVAPIGGWFLLRGITASEPATR